MSNNNRNDKLQRRGVYFALAMCLVAIAVAGAATYDSVMAALEPADSSSVEVSFEPEREAEDPEYTEEVAGPTSAPQEESETAEPPAQEEDDSKGEAPDSSGSSEGSRADSEENSDVSGEETSMEPVNTEPQYYADTWVYPVNSTELLSEYSAEPVYSPIMKDYRSHNGIDISCSAGETVRAVTGGKVISTGRDLLLGNYIEIEHGDITATYAGLGDTFLVEEGDIVSTGLPIGSVGTVPAEEKDTPHLHLEMKLRGEYMDPMSIIN